MSEKGHNRPPGPVELTEKMAQFVIRNCETNLRYGVQILLSVQKGTISVETGKKVVAQMEQFRELRRLVLAAGHREEDES